MSSLNHLWDHYNKPFDPVDRLVEKWASVVAPIFVNSVKSALAADGLGSSFLVTTGQNLYLVTALHVVQDANRFRHQIANIGGKAVDLGGLPFRISTAHDVAVVHLTDQWLVQVGLDEVKLEALPVKVDGEWEATGIFVLLGYPASKNRLDGRFDQLTRRMLSITTESAKGTPIATPVQGPIFFSYDHTKIINSELAKLGPQPALQGMSGGPALHLLARQNPDGEYNFTFSCEGVLCEWHKSQKIVVAAPFSIVKDLIEWYESQALLRAEKP